MKKRLLLLFSLMPVSLSGCLLFPTDAMDYRTPELFLEQVKGLGCHANVRCSEYDYEIGDCDFEIYNQLKTITDYSEIKTIQTSEHYFSYEEWIPATSGPNIARMTIYSNGYLEIYRKQSLGKDSYFHYTINEEQSVSLYEFVVDKVKTVIQQGSDL